MSLLNVSVICISRSVF